MGAHVGKLIEKKMEEKGIKASWLAEKINRDKSVVYRIFKQQSIHMGMLDQICLNLEHDFYSDCSKVMRRHIQVKKREKK